MNGITKFIDRVSSSESRGGRDLVLSMEDARLLRDEIAKLLLQLNSTQHLMRQNTTVELVGERW